MARSSQAVPAIRYRRKTSRVIGSKPWVVSSISSWKDSSMSPVKIGITAPPMSIYFPSRMKGRKTVTPLKSLGTLAMSSNKNSRVFCHFTYPWVSLKRTLKKYLGRLVLTTLSRHHSKKSPREVRPAGKQWASSTLPTPSKIKTSLWTPTATKPAKSTNFLKKRPWQQLRTTPKFSNSCCLNLLKTKKE